MKDDKEHIKLKAIDRQSQAFFAGGTFRWQKSEAEVLAELNRQLDRQAAGRSFRLSRRWVAVAASLLLIVGLGSFLRFYAIRVDVSAGTHQLVDLPDGSSVELNAGSSLTYYPYWWSFKRIVTLDGEAFFEVQKGRSFVVRSLQGRTTVLGTSFNILARGDNYRVTCLSGRVGVRSKQRQKVVLMPGSQAVVQPDGKIEVRENIETYPEISWREHVFVFTETPIQEVFEEIERQYKVTIQSTIQEKILYTGNFTKEEDVENILEYVCPAVGLKYSRKSPTLYFITQANE